MRLYSRPFQIIGRCVGNCLHYTTVDHRCILVLSVTLRSVSIYSINLGTKCICENRISGNCVLDSHEYFIFTILLLYVEPKTKELTCLLRQFVSVYVN